MSPDSLISRLGLERNPLGGWYRATHQVPSPSGGRPLSTVITYLLTADDPCCMPHRSSATALHYFHGGSPMTVLTVGPDGSRQRQLLGPPPHASLQVFVPGGTWKGLLLEKGDYALISEAVVPGWTAEDAEIASAEAFRARDPEGYALLSRCFEGAP